VVAVLPLNVQCTAVKLVVQPMNSAPPEPAVLDWNTQNSAVSCTRGWCGMSVWDPKPRRQSGVAMAPPTLVALPFEKVMPTSFTSKSCDLVKSPALRRLSTTSSPPAKTGSVPKPRMMHGSSRKVYPSSPPDIALPKLSSGHGNDVGEERLPPPQKIILRRTLYVEPMPPTKGVTLMGNLLSTSIIALRQQAQWRGHAGRHAARTGGCFQSQQL
jgi:hypothetical protein